RGLNVHIAGRLQHEPHHGDASAGARRGACARERKELLLIALDRHVVAARSTDGDDVFGVARRRQTAEVQTVDEAIAVVVTVVAAYLDMTRRDLGERIVAVVPTALLRGGSIAVEVGRRVGAARRRIASVSRARVAIVAVERGTLPATETGEA